MLNIRSLRERAGITQVELAERLKVSQALISAYENGERTPRTLHLPRIAMALNTTVAELFEHDAVVNNAELA